MPSKIALIVAGRSFNLVRSRLPLMKKLIDQDWQVYAASQSQPILNTILNDNGIDFIDIPFCRHSFSAYQDFISAKKIYSTIKKIRPHLIHFFSPKPIVLGGQVMKVYKNKCYTFATVTGLGDMEDNNIKNSMIRYAYRSAIRRMNAVIFENEENRKFCESYNISSQDKGFVQISSGVDLSKYQQKQQEITYPIKILFASRLLWSKGVNELFCAAKEISKLSGNKIQFVVAGEMESDHPAGVPVYFIEKYHEAGIIDYLGVHSYDKMPELISSCDIIVLPSYREGFSKFLMEGAAAGKALVATDIPGCREIVRDGETGWTVPVKDTTALITTLQKLIRNPDDIVRFGKNARELAENQFNQEIIVKKTIEIYRQSGCHA